MKRTLLVLWLGLFASSLFAQIQSPDNFLGYELGTRFSAHQKVVDYFKEVAAKAGNVKLQSYGKTYEGRELLLAIISDASNMQRLEQIRTNNIAISNNDKSVKLAKQPVIVWLSYNVHGNEANSTETAMKVLYTLAAAKDEKTKQWLKNTIVIIDPCLNPDGRERYVNYFNSVVGTVPNPDPAAREHYEPWPGGRSNHYYFDLNRDWAWQTQIESEQRLRQYHQWLPQVHVDFHEQGYNEPYYFAPAAEPIHQSVTAWQRDFQVIVGKNNAKYFDENGWQYFTKERFDLLYPSYGDTYPLYNGAIGMTYEQGGIKAGLAVVTADGDTLTLKDRISHHFATSMSTLEISSAYAEKLVTEFRKFFEQSLTPATAYKSYVIKAQNISRLRKLAELLTKNKISYAFGSEKGDRSLNGYNYETQKVESFKLERNDMVVNVAQKHGVLANILFEPQTFVADSNTYDITAWALPYAYGLNAYGLKENVLGGHSFIEEPKRILPSVAKPYAWVLAWGSIEEAKTLVALQQKDIKVRMAEQAFTIGGVNYKAGTLLVYRAENEKKNKNFTSVIQQLLTQNNVVFSVLGSGYVEKGKDFGSSSYRLLATPKIAVLGGQETSSQSLGEIWHFFEQELNYPISIVNVATAANLDINQINTLIVPDGYYAEKLAEQLAIWVSTGGKLILLEDAIAAVIGKKPFQIKRREEPKNNDAKSNTQAYSSRDHDDFSNSIPGAIYKVYLDQTHPLSYGIGKYYYTLKTDANIYEPFENGYNIGLLKPDSYVAGVAGAKVKAKIASGMLYGVQEIGKGRVLYIATGLIFRQFWEGGKQVLVNGVFLD
ncbi:M14 family metallopeptidase [Pedobacter sp. SL55]|uniref:M14 family metallopeptidase n=1 Tax=Pedobacter sp. SL55 TaxID=2995161 RepID=UPI00226E1856|nr:M14 family metallopeptidase [Pedobacter sp. SL55]WAC41881.1 M14 family metallopeptidase [Pedobacter sp. SL55]